MKTITVDIIHDEALRLLRDLEELKLIRLKEISSDEHSSETDWSKYKGAMSKQPIKELDKELKQLRDEWDSASFQGEVA
jgi:hypothetical protein